MMCFVSDCKHYSEKHGCRYFRFPQNLKEKKRWITLIRQKDKEPTKHSKVCSCHFEAGIKKNGPTMFERNKDKSFDNWPTINRVRAKRPRKQIDDPPVPSTSTNVLQEKFSSVNEEGLPTTRHALKKNAVPTQNLPVTLPNENMKNPEMVLPSAERLEKRAADTLLTQGESRVLTDKLMNIDGGVAVPSLNLNEKECSETSSESTKIKCENVLETNETDNGENSEIQLESTIKTDHSTNNPSFYLLEHLPTAQTLDLSSALQLNVPKYVSNEFSCGRIILNQYPPTPQAVSSKLNESKDVLNEFDCAPTIILNPHLPTLQTVDLTKDVSNEIAHEQIVLNEHQPEELSNVVPNELPCEQIIVSESLENNTINEQMCRLCLEEKPEMWSFFSVLTFEDKSTLDIVQAFQALTMETIDLLETPKLPKQICKTCMDLLVSAHNFREKYEESLKIITEFLTKDNGVQEKIPRIDCDLKQENVTPPISPGELDKIYSELPDEDSEESAGGSEEFVEALEDTDVESNQSEEAVNVKEHAPVVKFHRCPICLKEFTALKLKQHCRTHAALKKYLNAAPKFNKKVRFYATPRTRNVCLFYKENVLHACPFCAEEFDGEQFKDHVLQHRKEGNFRCNVCNRIFLGRNHLKMHQLSHRREAPYKCLECGKGFFKQKNFNFHKLGHATSEDLPFKCKHCDRTFSNPEHLKRHSFSHEKSISYQAYYKRSTAFINCKQCLQKFRSDNDLQNHHCRLCCAKCHKIFGTKKDFTAHVCKYKLKTSKCDPCGKAFQLPSSYSTHKSRCAYKTLCYVCGKNVWNLTQHLQSHYPQKRGCFVCAQCGKQFGHKMYLARHVKAVHTDVLSFRCQYCFKGFKSKWNMTVHERIHYGERKHICNICDKGFLEKSYLKKHLKVHFRQEPDRLSKQEQDSCEVSID